MRASFHHSVWLLLVGLIGAVSLWGQAAASLSGRVLDQDGGTIPGASITLTNLATGFERTVSADDIGEFSVLNIPLQTYELEVSSDGFAAYREAIPLRSNSTMGMASQCTPISVCPLTKGMRAISNQSSTQGYPMLAFFYG